MAPGGLRLVLLQDPDDSRMRMVRHFTGLRFVLRELAAQLTAPAHGPNDDIVLDVVPARYRGRDLEETVTVATFHLTLPGEPPPARHAVKAYVQGHLRDGDGGYVLRHGQLVLRIQRPAS
ncbi:hypothetical protein AB0F42_01940 [Streptomyces buecherae]|uniref:hypothetical protein n=1 Tax=Streptomyces buecherae TaxID=2763006 RepID=UPI003405ED59